MNAKAAQSALDSSFRTDVAQVKDPGASGTISPNYQGLAVCEVTTAAAESRVLDDADNYGVGQRLLVCLVSDGGNLTVDSDDDDVVMTAEGDCAEFIVSKTSTGKVWRTVVSNVT